MREGVGGAIGFVLREVEGRVVGWDFVVRGSDFVEGVKGSFLMSGKEEPGSEVVSRARNWMDLTKTTWQFSGWWGSYISRAF
jgi:hypothetical protein